MTDERIEALRSLTVAELTSELDPLGIVLPESLRSAPGDAAVVDTVSARELVDLLAAQNAPTGTDVADVEVDYHVETYGTDEAAAIAWLTRVAEVQPYVMAARYGLGEEWVAWGLDHRAETIEVQVLSQPAADTARQVLAGFDFVEVHVVENSSADLRDAINAVAARFSSLVERGQVADAEFLAHEDFDSNSVVLVVSPDVVTDDATVAALIGDAAHGIDLQIRREQLDGRRRLPDDRSIARHRPGKRTSEHRPSHRRRHHGERHRTDPAQQRLLRRLPERLVSRYLDCEFH